jgi:hypothetical protein
MPTLDSISQCIPTSKFGDYIYGLEDHCSSGRLPLRSNSFHAALKYGNRVPLGENVGLYTVQRSPSEGIAPCLRLEKPENPRFKRQ